MKRGSIVIAALGCACFLLVAVSMVRAEDAETTVTQLSSELQQAGVVTQNEASAIKSPLREMVEKGADKEELKIVVSELSKNGVKGNDLKKSVNSMKDLVKAGESPKEAGSIVSKAVAQAHQQGLKGKDLAAKVHEAINLRKAEKSAEAKEKAKKAKEEAKGKTKKVEKETRQKGTEIESKDKGKKNN